MVAARTCEHAPFRRRQTAHPGPGVHGWHFLRAPHRLPVEGPERHPLLPQLHGARPLPGVGAGGRLLRDVEGRAAGVRLFEGHRLGVAEHGRVHDQGTPWGGKRRAKTPPTVPRRAPNAASWSTATAFPWAWPWPGPTAPT